MYWAASGDELWVADSPLQLIALGCDGTLDMEALSVFLRIGFFLGDRTPFLGIRTLLPGSTLRWADGKVTCEGSELPAISASDCSDDELVDSYIDLFRESVSLRLPVGSEPFVPISGGRDSRMILLELLRQHGKGLRACTIVKGGVTSSPDSVIAGRVCAALDVPLVTIEGRQSFHDSMIRKNMITGLNSLEHTWIVPLWDAMATRATEVYDGFGAGVMSRSDLIEPNSIMLLKQRDWQEWSRVLANACATPSEEELGLLEFDGDLSPLLSDSWVDHLAEHVEPLIQMPNPIAEFSLRHWGGRSIVQSPLAMSRSVDRVHIPLADRQLMALMRGVPVERLIGNDLQTKALERISGDLSAIPFDNQLSTSTVRRRSSLVRSIGNRFKRSRFTRGSRWGLSSVGRGRRPGWMLIQLVQYLRLLELVRDQANANELIKSYGPGSRSESKARASLLWRQWQG
ncbi:MAG: hypothetical protein CMJ32_11005 [Phycisphaerae bacterium]|nr:hypothetical protein [Phycisphaerae bacterium]